MGDCMNEYMITQVRHNSNWVLKYDRKVEVEKLKVLLNEKKFLCREKISVVDVGCGNGRSAMLLLDIFGNKVQITAIDKCAENIQCAQEYIDNCNVSFQAIDAYDFFENKMYKEKVDIAFFSWSLFDMSNEVDLYKKKEELRRLIKAVEKSLTTNGIIIVLQPTKGGVFEQLLSDFMPGSDADYKLVHDFLIESGFRGATSPFPNKEDNWAIWSCFDYKSEEDIFLGVASIVFLEQDIKISKEYFHSVFSEFLEKHCCDISKLQLTDCVNLYYLTPGGNI